VVDLTSPPVTPPDVGGGGAYEYEDFEEPPPLVRLADFDIGIASESAYVVDLTPRAVRSERPERRVVQDTPLGPTGARTAVPAPRSVAGADVAGAAESFSLLELTPDFDEQDFEDLLMSGALDMLLTP
jgi:hypothetical protein